MSSTNRIVKTDVAIVGGGIVGASAALALRRKGVDVVLLERDLCGSRSSGVNYGGVRRQGRPLSQLPLARRAHQIWARLPELIGTDGEYQRTGHFKIARSEADLASLEHYADLSRDFDLGIALISGERLRAQAAQPLSHMQRFRQRLRGLSVGEALRAVANMPRVRLAAARDRRRVIALRQSGEPVPHDLRYADVEATHLRAYRDYVVRPYPGKLVLFRAEQQHPDLGSDPFLGWQNVAGEIEVFPIPGSHSGIVEKPELQVSLSQVVDAIRAGHVGVTEAKVAGTDPMKAACPPSRQTRHMLEQNA